MEAKNIKELGQMYFPNSTVKSASTQVVRWIRRNRPLWDALHAAGYHKGQRVFTPLQLEIIIDHLGEPENWNIK